MTNDSTFVRQTMPLSQMVLQNGHLTTYQPAEQLLRRAQGTHDPMVLMYPQLALGDTL